MATKRVAVDGSGAVALELDGHEYATIRRALAKALIYAREVCATADEGDLVKLLSALEPDAPRADTGFLLWGPPGWKHAQYEHQD